ncbi:MAG: hypothetical protein IJI98_08535 [Methanosphaera sp.]|uniref:hypothetical protein n=1 Tax=Methanosphaera sp. ISO3-F5 TaxID=1452353 RepID=UPI002B25FAA2|nr:hypothetical protein [Methanosphaera sp. ISO3-F5]MBR0472723.1 hypothetical protein [Methanosphaera sp.]WQH63262.1 hypothetical protein PXD04_05975 [Methanosphaera sp. ISO3-F5]
MEINNILDALIMDGVSEIVQYCECKYNDKLIEFRLINDDIGVVDEIEFKISEDEWAYEYEGNDEDMKLMVNAINEAPYEVFHKSDVGAELVLNHESIKPQNVPNHMKTGFYVDQEGPIQFTLIKNVVKLD